MAVKEVDRSAMGAAEGLPGGTLPFRPDVSNDHGTSFLRKETKEDNPVVM